MSTTVALLVTPRDALHPDRHDDVLPRDLAAVLAAAGQPLQHGLARQGAGPVRVLVQLSGPDRLETGRRLEHALRQLGYEADLSITP